MNFTFALVLGAFLLAAWADMRLEQHRPASLRSLVVHVVVSCVLLQIATIGVALIVGQHGGTGRQFTAAFGLLLPTLVYAFLSGLWLIRTLADVGLARR
jgi:hypothetical protein